MIFRGKFLIGHCLIAIIVLSCFLLSNWQFSRLNERKELNNRIEEKMKSNQASLTSITHLDMNSQELESIEYRKIKVSGIYDERGEIFISGRSRDGEPGYNVVTPLYINLKNQDQLTKKTNVVFINRGWISQRLGDDIRSKNITKDLITPNQGYESYRKVEGLVRLNEAKALFGQDTQVDEKRVSSRIDTELFLNVLDVEENQIFSLWIHELREDNSKTFPKSLEEPELTLKNHLSYALQWAAFGFIALITWIIICRKATMKGDKIKSDHGV